MIDDSRASKDSLRKFYKKIRAELSKERRNEAEQKLLETLRPLFSKQSYILSFASRSDEISTNRLNIELCTLGKLVLPKVEEDHLELFLVQDLAQDLLLSKWNIYEPNPSLTQRIEVDAIGLAIVPGLAFDVDQHRLGYGKGHYDKLFANSTAHLIAVGFKEQLFEGKLPKEMHDRVCHEVMLF